MGLAAKKNVYISIYIWRFRPRQMRLEAAYEQRAARPEMSECSCQAVIEDLEGKRETSF